MPDEVAGLEEVEVRRQTCHQLIHGTGPEDSTDDRGRLQRRLFRFCEQVDASREHGLDGIGNLEAGRELTRVPASVRAFEDSCIDQALEDLFDEEGVAFGPLHDQFTHSTGKLACEQRIDEQSGCVRRERIEPDRLAVHAAAPAGPASHEVGACSRQQQQRAGRVPTNPLDQIEQGLLGPMRVLDQQDERTFGRQL